MVLEDKKDAKETIIEYFGTDEFKKLVKTENGFNKVEEALSEIADSNVDIYNYDLLEWAKIPNNQYDINCYKNEYGGIDLEYEGSNIIFSLISGGQYCHNLTLLNEAFGDLKKEYGKEQGV